MGFTLKEYKAAWRAAFGPLNKQKVLEQAAKDRDLSAADLVKLDNWARRMTEKAGVRHG